MKEILKSISIFEKPIILFFEYTLKYKKQLKIIENLKKDGYLRKPESIASSYPQNNNISHATYFK